MNFTYNNKSSENSTNIVLYNNIAALNKASDLIENYAIRFISILGILINFCSLILILIYNKKLNHYIYNYIWSRFFCSVVVCVTGAGHIKDCSPNCRLSYFTIYIGYVRNKIIETQCV